MDFCYYYIIIKVYNNVHIHELDISYLMALCFLVPFFENKESTKHGQHCAGKDGQNFKPGITETDKGQRQSVVLSQTECKMYKGMRKLEACQLHWACRAPQFQKRQPKSHMVAYEILTDPNEKIGEGRCLWTQTVTRQVNKLQNKSTTSNMLLSQKYRSLIQLYQYLSKCYTQLSKSLARLFPLDLSNALRRKPRNKVETFLSYTDYLKISNMVRYVYAVKAETQQNVSV